MPEVSIIIPFNNVENYIEQCLNTVISQTLKDIEIILINDASTDKSRSIVLDFMQKDKRIKLIELNERKGQGFARNRGIELAKGEYIGFVDSDDFIEPDMFEKMYNTAKNSGCDIIMCLVKEYDDLNDKYITSDYYSLAPLCGLKNNIFSAKDTKDNILDINVALWNKIYKRSYLKKTGEKFPEGFIYEDLPFFFGTYLPAEKIQIIWEFFYNYRINRKNSTMQQFNNKILDRLPMVSLTYEKLKNTPYLKDLQYKIKGWIINDLFHRYTLLKENYHKEFFFQMKKIFESLEIKDIDNPYWKRVYHFQGYLMVMNNTFENFNQKVFTEYLDIHKVEDRLRSEMSNTEETDTKISGVYEEITKNYKYTEDLAASNYNNLHNEIKKSNDKIAVIYDEITKNYEKTEDLITSRSKDLYNDVKDLSYILNSNFEELKTEQKNIINNGENLRNNISLLEKEIKENITLIKSDLMNENKNKHEKILTTIENIEKNIMSYIDKVQTEIQTEKINTEQTITKLKKELNNEFEQKFLKYNEEITNLQKQLIEKEMQLREEMKSPFQKFIDKYNKREK